MRRSFPVLLSLLLLCAGPFYLPATHADQPHSQILSVDYPKLVGAGSSFLVTVRVAYSSTFGMMDVGLWDSVKGVVIQSLVSNATLSGAGSSTFTFNIMAPAEIGEWRLTAITRVWLQDAWFLDKAGNYPFEILVVQNAILTLHGLQPNSIVSLDGEPLTVNDSTVAVPVTLGVAHRLEVAPLIAEGPGRRVVFDSWSDGVRSNPRIIVLNSGLSISAGYKTQYFLSVKSDFGVIAGQGWYDAGHMAQFGVSSTIHYTSNFYGLLTDTYQFASWAGDTDSTLPLGSILMDGPKSVNARWSHNGTNLSLSGIAAAFLSAAVLLGFRGGRTALKQRSRRTTGSVRITAVLMLLLLSIPSSASMPAYAQLPTPIDAFVVSIGDASWYYWGQPGSDTCILWLGGGVEYSQGGYLINPYEYESFGTISFLQDLARYYCLVALEKGPYPSSNFDNRTIYQELVQGQFSVATELHQWLNSQGYKHVFLMGYSVGTEAAASIATSSPQTWTSSDGLILITASLPPSAIAAAHSLKANLLLLYGHAPKLEPTGLRFYEAAPSEGWHGSAYFHKEFRLLDEMGHEVWSPRKDNTYSPIALGITVEFIEKSKALQFGQLNIPSSPASSNSTYHISVVHAPSSVFWGEPFTVNATVTSNDASPDPVTVVASDSSGILSAVQFAGGPSANVLLVIPAISNSSEYSFSLSVLQKQTSTWQVASAPYPLTLPATGKIMLEVNGLIPNSNLIFDGTPYTASSSGQVNIETSRGSHSIEVKANVDQGKVRGAFIQWSDSVISASRTLELEGNVSLSAVYKIQYHVEVVSTYGSTGGTGWYDGYSTVEPSIQTPTDTQQSLAFSYWSNGNQSYGLGEPIHVSSPMTIEAVWVQGEQPKMVDRFSIALLATSILIFAVMLALNLKLTRKPRVV